MDPKPIEISEGQELKFESAQDGVTRVMVKLNSGHCECFGTILEEKRVYKFPLGTKAALSCPPGTGGCQVELMCAEKVQTRPWTGDVYTGMLATLTAKRNAARTNKNAGPRIIVIGDTDTGKSTLCKYIINSAVKSGHALTFVDGDLGQNSITVPGSLSSVFIEGEQVDVEESFTLLPPLAFFFGDFSLTPANVRKYQHLMAQTGACLKGNAQQRPQFLYGGIVVNTMGWVKDLGLTAIKMIIDALEIDTIISIGDSETSASLRNSLQPGGEIFDIPRSTSTITRTSAYRKCARGERVGDYFRGVKTLLHPVKAVVSFSDIELVQVGSGFSSGQTTELPDFLKIKTVNPDTSQILCIAAVSHAAFPEEVPHANIAGFVVILNVDMDRRNMTLLMPSGSQPPRRFLIVSRITVSYQDISG